MATAYEVIGVAETATEDQIRAMFSRELAQVHPDRDAGRSEDERSAAAERRDLLTRAFGLVGTKEARAAYDARLRQKRGAPIDAGTVKAATEELLNIARSGLDAMMSSERVTAAVGAVGHGKKFFEALAAASGRGR